MSESFRNTFLGKTKSHVKNFLIYKHKLSTLLFCTLISHTIALLFLVSVHESSLCQDYRDLLSPTPYIQATVMYTPSTTPGDFLDSFSFMLDVHTTPTHIICIPHNNSTTNRNKTNGLLMHKYHGHHIEII